MGLFFNKKKDIKPTKSYESNPYYESPEEKAALNNYYNCIEKMSGFRWTNPTISQIENYIKYLNKSIVNFSLVVNYWKRIDSIPSSIPPRDYGVDILMRVRNFEGASMLNEYFNELGISEYQSLETYDDVKKKIALYSQVADEIVDYINSSEIPLYKQLKKDLSHLDKNVVSWIVNKSYFIKKDDFNNDKLLSIDENYMGGQE